MGSNLPAKCSCGRCGRYKFPRCNGIRQETRAHIVSSETLEAHEVPENILSFYFVEEPNENNGVEHKEQINSTVTIDNRESSTNVDFDSIPCTSHSLAGIDNQETALRRGRKPTKVDRDVSAEPIGHKKTRRATAIDSKNIADGFQLQCPNDDLKKDCEARYTASRPLSFGAANGKDEIANANFHTRSCPKPRNAPRAPRRRNKQKKALPVESRTVTIDNRDSSTNVDFESIPCTSQSLTGIDNQETTLRRGRNRTKVDRDVSAQPIGHKKTRRATAIGSKDIANGFQLQCPNDDLKKDCEARHTASRPLSFGAANGKDERANANSQTRSCPKPRNAPRPPRRGNKTKKTKPVESRFDFHITCIQSQSIQDTNGFQLRSPATESVAGTAKLVGAKAKNMELTSQSFSFKVEVVNSDHGKESSHD